MSYNLSMSIILFIVTGCLLFGVSGCGEEKYGKYNEEQLKEFGPAKRNNLPVPSGEFIFSVRGEPLTYTEVMFPLEERARPFAQSASYEAFVDQVKPTVLNRVKYMVSDILLYEAAKRGDYEVEEMLKKEVEKEVNRFVAGFEGDYAKAQKDIEEQGMDWQSFRDQKKRQILVQIYLSQELADLSMVSMRDMDEYYQANKDTQFRIDDGFQFSLIDIVPAKINAADIKPGEDADAAAVRIAVDIVQQCRDGADFAKLAKKYSSEPEAQNGGLWEKLKPNALAEPYDVLEQEASKMDAGDITGPIVADGHIFIMKLHEYTRPGFIPFEDVRSRIKNEIEFTRYRGQFNELVDKIILQANMDGIEAFVDVCVKQAYVRYTQG